jgi:hypothetical protein
MSAELSTEASSIANTLLNGKYSMILLNNSCRYFSELYMGTTTAVFFQSAFIILLLPFL